MRALLHYGCRGAEIERLQYLLNKRLVPNPALKVDGVWGPLTDAAVRRFQSQSIIAVDGVVGSETWAALDRKPLDHQTINDAPNSCYGNAPWMSIAEREVGQEEEPKGRNNPRILEYHSSTSLKATSDEVAWCSAFVNWCLRKAGIMGTDSAAATSWLHWGRVANPTAGAITVVRSVITGKPHVAFLVSETKTHYQLLGGNQGDKVRLSGYPKSEFVVLGYRLPSEKR